MSKITRAFQAVFGGSLTPSTNTLPDFGSLAAGSPTASGNPVTMQTSAWLNGWAAAIVGNHSPALQDLNTVLYVLSRQIAYLFQEGLAEWDSGTTYFTNSWAKNGSGVPYKSLQDNNLNHALTDTSWWTPVFNQTTPRGAAVAFASFQGSSGTVYDSFNCTIARNSTGNYTATCAGGWGNITPVVAGSVGGTLLGAIAVTSTNATQVSFLTVGLNNTPTDFGTVYVAFFA